MTDLAATLTTLAAHVDRIGVTHADIISTYMATDGVLSLHLRESVTARLVAAHGDEGGHSVRDYTAPTGKTTHHHRVPVTGTDGKVEITWVTDAVVAAQAA